MKDLKEFLGFKIEYKDNQNLYELSDFPNFPDDTPQSKKIFDSLEISNFNKRSMQFPIKVNIIQKIKDVKYKDVKCFTLRDLYNVIKSDEELFINTNTFFKVHLEYENKVCVFSIFYFTISEDGANFIKNADVLLETIEAHYRKKKFLKKFVENKKFKKSNCPNYLQYIPLIPLSWLEYNKNNELCYIEYFEALEKNIELPF